MYVFVSTSKPVTVQKCIAYSLLGYLLTCDVDDEPPRPLGLVAHGLGEDDKDLHDGQDEGGVVPAGKDEGKQLLLHHPPSPQQQGDRAVGVVITAESTLQVLKPLEAVSYRHDPSCGLVPRSDDAAHQEQLVNDGLLDAGGGIVVAAVPASSSLPWGRDAL